MRYFLGNQFLYDKVINNTLIKGHERT